jgi:hypothetical protein
VKKTALQSPSKSARFLWCAPLLLWGVLAAIFAVRLAGWAPDDSYITYRYAQNLAQGHGFVFNPGERVFGSTDPGLGLLLGALHSVTRVPVPLISSAVFALSLLGIASIVLIEGRRRGYLLETVLGGTLLVTSSYFWSNQGAAAPLAILLLLLASLLSTRSSVAAGLLAGSAVWVRPDAGLGVVFLALILFSEGKRIPWRYLVAAGCVIAAGIGLAWLYYGHPLPNTLGAKTDMAAATPNSWSGFRFWLRAFGPIGRHFGGEWPAVLIAAVAGCWPFAVKTGTSGRLIVLFGLAIAVVYPLLKVPFFSWYILPCLVMAAYGLAFFAGAAGDGLARRVPSLRNLRHVAVICIFASLAFTTFRASRAYFQGFASAPYLESYRRGAEWIKANSEPGAAIAYVEIGVIGYYSERPVLDLMGLVTPWARPYVVQGDILGAFRAKPTEFVLFHTRGRMAPIVSSRWFRKRYREVMRFEDRNSAGKAGLQIYRRRASRPVRPAPRTAGFPP